MQNFSASPVEVVSSFWCNRSLIRNLVHREVVGRYKGSMLGIFWSLANPIFMSAVYTFVLKVVFKPCWNSGSDSKTEFALVLFAGLVIFNLLSLVSQKKKQADKIVANVEVGGFILNEKVDSCARWTSQQK